LASDALLTTTLHPLLENVLQTVDHFEISWIGAPFLMVGKAQKSRGARSGLYGGCSNEVPPIHFFQTKQISPHAISGLFQPRKGSFEARNFEVINGLQHVFDKCVKRYKKFIACQGRYFEKETVTAPPQSSDSE
jgi:hypothetical protein